MRYPFKGLDEKQVEESRREHGANELPPPKVEGFFEKLIDNFKDPLIHILCIALVITLVLALLGYAEWFEGVGIAFAVLLATTVSTYSEYKNEASFQVLQEKASRVKNNVFRNGNNAVNILASDIVVGDYVLLQAGDKIPADGILVAGEVDVNQSTLNGEPELEKKSVAPKGYSPHSDQDCSDHYLLFKGSVVENGEAVMLARSVGSKTVYGQLAEELVSVDERESPLQVKLSALAEGISMIGYVGASFIAVSFLFKQIVMDNHYNYAEIVKYVSQWHIALHDVVTSIILAIIVIVVAVPEGLPMMIAIVLSLNMRKLLKAKVLVRKLLGIETAGSVDILFVDKTGTITKGAFIPKLFVAGDLKDHEGFGEIQKPLKDTLAFAVRESTSSVIGPTGQLTGGNASDRALLEFLDKAALLEECDVEVLHEVVFNSQRKYSAAGLRATKGNKLPAPIVKIAGGDNSNKFVEISAVKGAPEIVLPKCNSYVTSDGGIQNFTAKDTQALADKVNSFSAQGIRVIAVAISKEAIVENNLPEVLTLVGVVGVLDELRAESKRALKSARQAGIQIVMITGDKQETAISVAQQVALIAPGDEKKSGVVLTSADLARMNDKQLGAVIPDLRVVARALPTDKSRFVRVAQGLHMVVGMTGDGVNDSAALKQADVGFALGSGSEVSKEAADIVILDDNFSSITQAVLYGRTIYKSIQKFIVFQSTINVASSLIVFLGPFLGFDFPLTLIQLLWVNLVMDTLAALAFGGEAALERYMLEKPIRRDAAIITPWMWFTLLSGGFFIAAASILFLTSESIADLFVRNGQPSEPAFLTAFFAFFIFLAVINAFNVRTTRLNLLDHLFDNKGFILVVTFIFIIQITFTYVGGKVLRTVGLHMNEWIGVILASLIIIPYGLAGKFFFYKFARSEAVTPRARKRKAE